ncbi:MAG: hypothetical protein RL213_1567 [Bacteroidota bacterium]|jgi:ABC-type multidrug transport system fused ATPase/permease subunit
MTTKKELLAGFFRNHPVLVLFTFLSGLINNLITLAIPVFIGKYYQLAFHNHSPKGRFLDLLLPVPDLDAFFLFFSLLVVAKAVAVFMEKYLVGRSAETFSRSLRERLFPAQLAFTQKAFESKSYGKYLLRYSGDLGAIQRYVSKGIIGFGIDILFVALTLSLLFRFNVRMTAVVAAGFILFFLAVYFLNNLLKVITVRRRNIRSELLSFVADRLRGLLTVKVFNREPLEEKKFNKSSGRLFGYGLGYYRLYGLISALFPFLLYSLLLFVMAEAHRLRVSDPKAFPAHELIIYIITLVNILPALRRTLEVSVVWQAGDVSIQKILRIFNAPKENKVKRDDAGYEDVSIQVSGLEFRHGENVIFSGVDLDIRPKSLTLIKGSQGSGKSSLFKILLGIYPYAKGRIVIDGQEADMTDVYTLRKNITLISEEVPLIGKTVFEAVSYSRKEEKREKAAEMLDKLQSFLPESRRLQLDHRLVNDGANLAAGQRRTLQFARALLTRKKIVLLDDPFQGLDGPSRAHFAKVIDRMRGKRTFLVASVSDIPELEFDQVVEMPEPQGR